MPVADPLPQAVERRWRAIATPDEEVMLTVASDVTADGTYGERWLVITTKRVVVLPDVDPRSDPGGDAAFASDADPDADSDPDREPGGALPHVTAQGSAAGVPVAFGVAELTDARTEPIVGGGRLEVYTGNVPVPLLEYSSSLG